MFSTELASKSTQTQPRDATDSSAVETVRGGVLHVDGDNLLVQRS
jgi:hypothetical protein